MRFSVAMAKDNQEQREQASLIKDVSLPVQEWRSQTDWRPDSNCCPSNTEMTNKAQNLEHNNNLLITQNALVITVDGFHGKRSLNSKMKLK